MIKTFTSEFEHTAKEHKKERQLFGLSSEVPSENALKNILNYSKNLEVKQSKLLPYLEFLKS
jgi:hypothetical protein